MQITRLDLDYVVREGLIQPQQADALWQFLCQQERNQPRLRLAHLLYYLGGLIAIAAMTLFVTLGWELLGGWGLLLVGGLYILLAVALTEYLIQHRLPVPAGPTAALAVALVPLAVYGLQKGLGLWPDGAVYRSYHSLISWRWILMELATLAAACLLFARYRLPFLLMPVAVTLWYLSMDLVPFLFGHDWGWELRRDFSLWFGLGMLVLAFLVDLRLGRRPDFGFWLYLFGMLAFWAGLSLSHSASELARLMYCLLNVGLLLVGTVLRRRVFVVFGGLGVAGYLGYLANRVFLHSLWFPVVLSFLGLAIVGLGIVWQRHERQFGARLRARLPARLRLLVEAGD